MNTRTRTITTSSGRASVDNKRLYFVTDAMLKTHCTTIRKVGYDADGYNDRGEYTATDEQWAALMTAAEKFRADCEAMEERERKREESRFAYRQRGHEESGCTDPSAE